MGTKLLLHLSLAFFYHYLTAHFLFGLHYTIPNAPIVGWGKVGAMWQVGE